MDRFRRIENKNFQKHRDSQSLSQPYIYQLEPGSPWKNSGQTGKGP